LQTERGENMKALGVRLPEYYFTTGQVSCREYVEGEIPDFEEMLELSIKLKPQLDQFLQQKFLEQDPLWENVHLDDMSGVLKPNNFIKTAEGELVWFDPFYYAEEVPNSRVY
ncbi:hypothetical protein KA001_02820, partial [Patescibacteria group bacterium]|nr:hypothetical protein [Patescibacteria group bacterium]